MSNKTTYTCNICGKTFTKEKGRGTICCPDCKDNKEAALNRPYTKDTIPFVCKWYREGDSVAKLADLLNRSEQNIINALELGGIEIK